jgi:hypothetical protein
MAHGFVKIVQADAATLAQLVHFSPEMVAGLKHAIE